MTESAVCWRVVLLRGADQERIGDRRDSSIDHHRNYVRSRRLVGVVDVASQVAVELAAICCRLAWYLPVDRNTIQVA